ncbi:MAG: glycosyltransferase family 2 protein [Chloroflexi bacterium]|nr:glycosyltransferase family 2 protein [Chloroflexota bacterium]MCL5074456.1 glycosyltransferase family 2 protein [Chloroflexota bacterium]
MKLIVQIPCYNEEQTLPFVVASIPREIPDVDQVEVLVVDDGSTDHTAEVARQLEVDHIVRHVGNKGLAAAFQSGLDACLKLGADIIVNTDGDNQYPQEEIPRLIRPIIAGEAEIVVGDRQTGKSAQFSLPKKLLQAIGSWTVRKASHTAVPDAPSGFRAFSREAALRLNVISKYTYTLETLIQAGTQRMVVAHIPITTHEQLRESRLIKGLWGYLKESAATIIRVYAMYEPLKVFFYLGLFLCLIGAAGVGRFLYYYFTGTGAGHVQSLILAAVFLIVGFQVFLIGLLADLIAANRRLLEEILYKVRNLEVQNQSGGEKKVSKR